MKYIKLFFMFTLILALLTLCSCQQKPTYDELLEENRSLQFEIEELKSKYNNLLEDGDIGYSLIQEELENCEEYFYDLYTDGYKYNYQEALEKLEEVQETAEDLETKLMEIRDIAYEYECEFEEYEKD